MYIHQLGILRPLLNAELDMVRDWRNAPAVRMNMYTQHEISRTEHAGWWDDVKRDGRKQYMMYVADESPCGIVAFTAIDQANQNCAWAFYTAPSAPRGAGSRMDYLALEHVFTVLGLQKLYCEVLSFNAPVLRMHKKFGFVEEGVFRHQYKAQDGYVDVHRLGLLRDEWLAKRDQLLAVITRTTHGPTPAQP
jgi:UDP-4-amino-4,6-dideoxy-N-acetyl-beta-L-altrosamine N-acetyltransferase